MYGVMCNVSGGITGNRSAWLKTDNVVEQFETLAAAEKRARELQQPPTMYGARFTYRAMEM